MAEEAAHYARLWNDPGREFGPYRVALEEALAFMASTWFDPARKPPVKNAGKKSAWEAAHRFGYRLGFRLSRRWHESARSRTFLRRIWSEIPSGEQEARDLVERLLSPNYGAGSS
jgi:hypothetical protein